MGLCSMEVTLASTGLCDTSTSSAAKTKPFTPESPTTLLNASSTITTPNAERGIPKAGDR